MIMVTKRDLIFYHHPSHRAISDCESKVATLSTKYSSPSLSLAVAAALSVAAFVDAVEFNACLCDLTAGAAAAAGGTAVLTLNN